MTESGEAEIPGRWLFAIVLALLISHELDAMIRAEWALLPGLNQLDDSVAADWFNLLHVPIFGLLLWFLTSSAQRSRRRAIVVVNIFVAGHAVVHAVVRGADAYHFEAPVEPITVYLAGILAGIHLFVLRRSISVSR